MSVQQAQGQGARHQMTRRGFFQMAVGSFTVLPVVAGGYLVRTRDAHAAEGDADVVSETDGGPLTSPATEIVIVAGYELGVNVVDAASGDDEDPVVGAFVRVTSRYNGKEVSGNTDEKGRVTFDISELAEDLDGVGPDKLTAYAFNGTITVTCPGYREYEMALTRLEGGGGVRVCTRNLDEGEDDPYPRRVSFNEWDVLYTTDNVFLTTPKNENEHELSVEFRQMTPGAATLYLKERGSGDTLMTTTSTVGSDGILNASFVGQHLKQGSTGALPLGKLFYVEVVQGDDHSVCPIQLSVKEGVTDESQKTDAYTAKPIDTTLTSTTMAQIKWPAGIPILGGSELKGFSPDFYVNAFLNPLGYFQLTVKTPSFGYVRDSGHQADDDGQGWQEMPCKFPDKWWDKGWEDLSAGASRAKQGYDGSGSAKPGGTAGSIKPIDTFASIKMSANLQLVAIAKWDEKTAVFQGLAAGQVFASVILAMSYNCWVGAIPFLITFDFNFTTIISYNAGFYTEPELGAKVKELSIDPSKWKWDYADTGLTFTFNLIPSLSVGVGVRGIGSVSVRGRFQLTLFLGVNYRGDLDRDVYELPHLIGGYAAQISLVISMFFFTQTFNFKNWKYRTFYDNWEKDSLKAAADEAMGDAMDDWRREQEGLSLSDVVDRLKIIGDTTLSKTTEFKGTATTQDPDQRDFDWETASKGTREAQLDTGETISYRVYSMSEDDTDRNDSPTGRAQSLAGEAEGASVTGAAKGRGRRRGPVRRPSPVEYEPVGGGAHGALSAMADGERLLATEPRVSTVGNFGGVRLEPETDKIIAGNTSGDAGKTPYVFGDPRLKVATITTSIDGTYLRATCTFRIGVVEIDGVRRSRVIMTVIDASTADGSADGAIASYIGYSKPIDFELSGLSVSHADLFDYEFDIAFTTVESAYGSIDMVHLVVVSGKRTFDDATTIVEASTSLVVSYANFHASEAFGRTSYLVKSVSASDIFGTNSYGGFHSISNVRIATDGTDASWRLLIGMLDRSSDTAEAVLTDNYGDGTGGTVKTGVVFAMFDQREEEWVVPDRDHVDDAMNISEIRNGTVLGMSISPKIDGAYTVSLTSTTETFFFVVRLNDDMTVFTSIKMAPMLESNMRLVPWPQEGCFLTTYPDEDYLEELNESGDWKRPDSWDRSRWVLQKAWWEEELDTPGDTSTGTPVLHFQPIGPANFNIDTFGINSSGSFIYWPQGREGNDGRVYNMDGTYEPLDEDDDHLYQLMAARVYRGFFSDPFVVAEVDHDMSDLSVIATNDRMSPLAVLSVEHVPSGTNDEGDPVYLHHEANVWYTAVPHVVCATAVDCYAPMPFVSAGGTLAFHVTIRNDGNCYLRGCTIQLCLHETVTDENGNKTASTDAEIVEGSRAKLWIGEDTLRESHFNPRNNETGELEGVEVDFSLAPGKRSVYEVRLPIPKDWEEGTRYVSVVASVDASEDVAQGGALNAMPGRPTLSVEADTDVVYQEFAMEPGVFRPYLQRSTPEVDRNQTHMDAINVGTRASAMDGAADAPMTHWRGKSDYVPDEGTTDDGGRDDDRAWTYPYGGSRGAGGTGGTGGPRTRITASRLGHTYPASAVPPSTRVHRGTSAGETGGSAAGTSDAGVSGGQPGGVSAGAASGAVLGAPAGAATAPQTNPTQLGSVSLGQTGTPAATPAANAVGQAVVLPGTGDRVSGSTGALAAAAAAAGAALVAYGMGRETDGDE